jgi:hypothetical protein
MERQQWVEMVALVLHRVLLGLALLMQAAVALDLIWAAQLDLAERVGVVREQIAEQLQRLELLTPAGVVVDAESQDLVAQVDLVL